MSGLHGCFYVILNFVLLDGGFCVGYLISGFPGCAGLGLRGGVFRVRGVVFADLWGRGFKWRFGHSARDFWIFGFVIRVGVATEMIEGVRAEVGS